MDPHADQNGAPPQNPLERLTQAAGAIEADDVVTDEGYAESTTTSYVTSIASSIRRGIEENGRLYANYGQHLSALPIDEHEMERNDLQHAKFILLLGHRLHLSPPIKNTAGIKILDLGTGTGIWALDMADANPAATVMGVDIAPVQPQWVPPNCSFELDDVENEWLYKDESFDFIHGRELLLAIRNWPNLLRQAFRTLKPGGYLELAATVAAVGCDDGTFSMEKAKDSAYAKIGKTFFELHEALGADPAAPMKWKEQMLSARLEDVQEFAFKIPTNPWPKDQRLKQIGAFELAQFRDGVANLFERGWTGVLGRPRAEFEVIMAHAKQEAADPSRHTYVYYYVVYGKKPERVERTDASLSHEPAPMIQS